MRSKIQVLNNAGLTCGRSFTYLFGGNFLSSLEIAFSTLFRLSFFCSISNFCDTVPLQTILFIFGSTKVNIKIDAVTGTRRLGFCLFLPWKILTLCRRRQHDTAVTQRFLHFSTHPQPMQQHRKLSCRRNHRDHDGCLMNVSGANSPRIENVDGPPGRLTDHPQFEEVPLRDRRCVAHARQVREEPIEEHFYRGELGKCRNSKFIR